MAAENERMAAERHAARFLGAYDTMHQRIFYERQQSAEKRKHMDNPDAGVRPLYWKLCRPVNFL